MSLSITPKLRELVAVRDGSRCSRCSRSVLNVPASVHHRRARGMGGTRDPRSNDPRNLVRLCGTGTTGCHGWVESNRARALELGWLIRGYHELDRPMLTITGVRIFLFADGTRTDLAPEQDPPSTIH